MYPEYENIPVIFPGTFKNMLRIVLIHTNWSTGVNS